jgi:hypothetical protein
MESGNTHSILEWRAMEDRQHSPPRENFAEKWFG